MKTILVTGAAGFIGSNLVKRLCKASAEDIVVGIDNMNDYYDVRLKEQRLEELLQYPTFKFVKGNIADKQFICEIFAEYRPQIVVNLAAQAGVRYSIINPDAYIESNIIGFYNILEACRHNSVEHLVYASSSSVYGNNEKIPYSTDDKVDNPVSLYAATKKSNELMAHAYSKLYNIPTTGLRFFTVYGPAGRPDMAYFGFTDKLVKGEKIQIFNYGNCKRDFTYIDDIVEGVYRVMMKAPKASPQPSPKGNEASPQPSPKRKGVHTADPLMYDLLKTYAEENRKNPTEAESVLWEALKAKGIDAKFRRQHIIGDFIVDFYCNEANLVIELDGGYHNRPTQMKSDAERTAALKAMGYTELRFKNEEVICNIDAVLKTIKTFTNTKSFPSGEDLGEAIKSFPSGEDLGEAVKSFPSGENPGEAIKSFPSGENPGEAIKSFPSGENPGEAIKSFPLGEDLGEAVKSFPLGEDLGEAFVPYAIYNIGNNSPENLLDFVTILQEELLRAGVLPRDYDFESHKELVPMQPGDVPVTYADTSALEADFGFKPCTPLREGLRKFAEWYKEKYNY